MPTGDLGQPFVDRALAYAKAVTADRRGLRHGKLERQACQRFLDMVKQAKRKDSPFAWSPWDVHDVCEFAESMPHIKGRWATPTIVLEDVQVWLLAAIFGFRDRVSELRWVTRAYIEMARKNAKSTLAAVISLYCLTHEGEPGPEIVIGATTGQQAGKVFEPAKMMVDRKSEYRAHFGLKAWSRSITCKMNDGTVQPINSRSTTQDGWNPYLAVLDELHAHTDRGLYDVIRSAFGARKAWLLLMITTAGFSIRGVCYEQRGFVVKLLGKVVDDSRFFGVIFTIDSGDDPFDERCWGKANPLLGSAVQLEEMRQIATEAKSSPGTLGNFKTKRLNMWLNAAEQWLSVEGWKKCADPALTLDRFKGLECSVGGDLADRDDITAVVLAGQNAEQILLRPFFFIPADALERESNSDTGQSTYAAWAGVDPNEVQELPPLFDEAGEPVPELPEPWTRPLLVTPGDFIDHDKVEELVRWLGRTLSLRRAVFDQFAAAQTMAARLNVEMGDDFAAVLHKNAANVTDPAKLLEASVRAGVKRLVHDGNPVMEWMVSNAVVTRRVDGSIIPKKQTQDSPEKIDGVDAAVNALHFFAANDDDDEQRKLDAWARSYADGNEEAA